MQSFIIYNKSKSEKNCWSTIPHSSMFHKVKVTLHWSFLSNFLVLSNHDPNQHTLLTARMTEHPRNRGIEALAISTLYRTEATILCSGTLATVLSYGSMLIGGALHHSQSVGRACCEQLPWFYTFVLNTLLTQSLQSPFTKGSNVLQRMIRHRLKSVSPRFTLQSNPWQTRHICTWQRWQCCRGVAPCPRATFIYGDVLAPASGIAHNCLFSWGSSSGKRWGPVHAWDENMKP